MGMPLYCVGNVLIRPQNGRWGVCKGLAGVSQGIGRRTACVACIFKAVLSLTLSVERFLVATLLQGLSIISSQTSYRLPRRRAYLFGGLVLTLSVMLAGICVDVRFMMTGMRGRLRVMNKDP